MILSSYDSERAICLRVFTHDAGRSAPRVGAYGAAEGVPDCGVDACSALRLAPDAGGQSRVWASVYGRACVGVHCGSARWGPSPDRDRPGATGRRSGVYDDGKLGAERSRVVYKASVSSWTGAWQEFS